MVSGFQDDLDPEDFYPMNNSEDQVLLFFNFFLWVVFHFKNFVLSRNAYRKYELSVIEALILRLRTNTGLKRSLVFLCFRNLMLPLLRL